LTYILFGLGILFILLGFIDIFPRVKQSYLDAEDLYKWQKQKNEVTQAKEDLMELMDELRRVSDQVVENIELKVQEVQNLRISSEFQQTVQPKVNKNNSNEKQAHNENQIANEVYQKLENLDGKVRGSNLKTAKIKADKKKPSNEVKGNKAEAATIDKHTYIYQLAKEGLSVEEIARKVQVGKGEVELIIGIKQRGEQV
jgi:hypothetical protein